MDEILFKSTAQLARSIRSGEISSRQLVDGYLARISTINPKLNAVVQLNASAAQDRADQLDKCLEQEKIMGPLHGVPMTIKDSFDTKGVISAAGTLGRRNFKPTQNATIVKRLEQAGAILLGKTNTSELTLSYDTDNPVYGRTANPYGLTHTPGGSSGGGAAIVAAGGSAFDIGSDYGGSLRYPAHCCGIVTIKPTSGRVPRTGHILPPGGILDSFQQIGPLVRRVEDLMLLLEIIAGPDDKDPFIIPMALSEPKNKKISDLRIAFHTDNGIVAADSNIDAVVRKTVAMLEDAGCRVVEKRPQGIEKSHELAMGLWAADGGASIRRMLKDAGTTDHSIVWLKHAKAATADQMDRLMIQWAEYQQNMLRIFDSFDIIICPVNAAPALEPGEIGKDLRAFSYTSAYNLTGWPGVVIRGGRRLAAFPLVFRLFPGPGVNRRPLRPQASWNPGLGTSSRLCFNLITTQHCRNASIGVYFCMKPSYMNG